MLQLFDNKYPYTDFHELNLDWIISRLIQMDHKLTNFVSLNTIKYADPIAWDITKQYEMNTVVIDSNTGIAYISSQPVPSGVSIGNTDYWSVIFDLQQIIGTINENLTFHNNGTSPTLLTNVNADEWILWNGYLYKALVNMTAGTALIEGTNIERHSVEELTEEYTDNVATTIYAYIATLVGDLNNLTTSDKTSVVNAINSLLADIVTIIGDLNNLTTTDKTSVVNAINSVISDISTIIGDLNNLTTVDKSSVVNAINELVTSLGQVINDVNGVINDIGDLNNLTTSDKTSLVNAINEVAAKPGGYTYNPIENFNLDNTGATDNASKFASIPDNVGLKAGTYLISSDCIINCQLVFAEGAILDIQNNATVIFNGEIVAGRYQIFTSFANLEFPRTTTAFPEWFGAKNDGTTDCTAAIQKCFNSFDNVVFDRGSYKVSSTLKITRPHLHVRGQGIWADTNMQQLSGGTVIFTNSTSDTILQVGTDSQPASFNNFLPDIEIRSIMFWRPNTWLTESIGIRVQYIIRSNFIDVMAYNSSRNFSIMGNVYTRFIRCQAHSAILPDSDLTRSYAGFFMNAATGIGAAGGNASLYILECSSSAGGVTTTQSYAVQAFGTYGVADIYIDKLECVGVGTGIVVQGNNTNNGSLDINIANCVLDQIGLHGIEISNMAYGSCKLYNNYIGLGAKANGYTGTQSAIAINGCKNVTAINNELICIVGGTNNEGFTVGNTTNSTFVGNIVYDALSPYVIISCSGLKIIDEMSNDTNTATYGLSLIDTIRCIIEMSSIGKYTYPIRANGGATNNYINITAINRSNITAPAIINAVAVSTSGTYNTCVVTGA